MRLLPSGFLILLAFLVLTGCQAHLSPSEVQTMKGMNAGWRQDLKPLESVMDEASIAYRSFHDALNDTSNFAAKQALTDSLFMAGARQVTNRYQRWFGASLACVKSLVLMIDQNERWLMQIDPAHAPRDVTRRSWDSRRSRFYNSFEDCRSTLDDYKGLHGEMAALRKRVGAK